MRIKCGQLNCEVISGNIKFSEEKPGVFVCSAQPALLGEGLFFCREPDLVCWFDILGSKLHLLRADHLTTITLPFSASCGADCGRGTIIIASEKGLFHCNVENLEFCKIPTDNFPAGRSIRTNDGRRDSAGGFWFSTMQNDGQSPVGKIFRFHDGVLNEVCSGVRIPNSLCFTPDNSKVFFSDTSQQKLFSLPLESSGHTLEETAAEIDFSSAGLFPDGAIVDDRGFLHIAMWGGGCVVRFDPQLKEVSRVHFPATNITCPGIDPGSKDRLWITSASDTLPQPSRLDGRTMYRVLA